MVALWINLRASFRGQNLQRILIFLTLLLATALFTVGVSITDSVRQPFERVFAEAQSAHMWVKVRGSAAELAAARETMSSLAGVSDVTEIRPSGYLDVWVDGQLERIVIQGLEYNPTGIAQPLVMEGRSLAEDDALAILVDRNWATARGIQVGDRLAVATTVGGQELQVVGLSLHFAHPPYSEMTGPPLNFIPIDHYQLLREQVIASETVIGLQLDHPENVVPTWSLIRAHLGEVAYDFDNWQVVREQMETRVRLSVIFLASFGLFALVASGFIIWVTISNAVVGQARQIGLLQVVGFTGRQIMVLFLAEYLLLALISGLVGFFVGTLVTPLFAQGVTAALNTPGLPIFSPLTLAVVTGSVLSVVFVATFWPAFRAGRLPPMETILQETNTTQSGSRVTGKMGNAFHWNVAFPLRMGLKEAGTINGRKLLTLFSIALTTVALVFSIGIRSTVLEFVATPSLFGPAYDAFITLTADQVTPGEMESLLQAQPDVTAFFSQIGLPVQVAAVENRAMGFFRQGDSDLLAFDLSNGRMFAEPGEAVISRRLAEVAHLDIGDTFAANYNTIEMQLVVVGIAPTLGGFLGPEFAAAGSTLAAHNLAMPPRSFFLAVATDPQVVITALIDQTGGNLTAHVVDRTVPAEIQALPELIAGLAVVLMLVTLLGIFNTLAIETRNQFRKFAILKAVGVTPQQIVLSIVVGSSILALLTALISLPIGVFVTHRLFVALANLFNYTREIPLLTNSLLLALVPLVILLVTALGALLPSLWASRVRPDALSRTG